MDAGTHNPAISKYVSNRKRNAIRQQRSLNEKQKEYQRTSKPTGWKKAINGCVPNHKQYKSELLLC